MSTLTRLRVHGAEPDPDFRAGLRAQLVAAATDRDALDRALGDRAEADRDAPDRAVR